MHSHLGIKNVFMQTKLRQTRPDGAGCKTRDKIGSRGPGHQPSSTPIKGGARLKAEALLGDKAVEAGNDDCRWVVSGDQRRDKEAGDKGASASSERRGTLISEWGRQACQTSHKHRVGK